MANRVVHNVGNDCGRVSRASRRASSNCACAGELGGCARAACSVCDGSIVAIVWTAEAQLHGARVCRSRGVLSVGVITASGWMSFLVASDDKRAVSSG